MIPWEDDRVPVVLPPMTPARFGGPDVVGTLIALGPLGTKCDRGSGIVCRPDTIDPDYVHVWYEGNRFSAANVVTYADRVRQAADRMLHNYPTSARACIRADQVVHFAWWDGERVVLDEEKGGLAMPMLEAWLGLAASRLEREFVTSS